MMPVDAQPPAPIVVEIPRCYEDEPFLIGSGDFENGRWSHYECVHIDSITLA